MKQFIKGLLLFYVPIVLITTFALLYIDISIKNKFEDFRLSENINKIVIGDSHIRLAIDDRMIENTKNIALDSEGYLYSFYKLKTLIDNNPNIDTVYLGASYHNFSAYYDDSVNDPNVLSNYFFILPFSEKIRALNMIENKTQFLLNSLKLLTRPSNYLDWLGSYADYTTKHVLNEKSINKRIESQYYANSKLQTFSTNNIIYFNKIVDLCNNSHKNLIILNTPLYSVYKNKVPRKFIDNFYSIIRKQNLKINEFNDNTFNANDFLPDGDHVSRSGAIKSTLMLNKSVRM